MFTKLMLVVLSLSLMPVTSIAAVDQSTNEFEENQPLETRIEFTSDYKFVELDNGEILLFPTEQDYQTYLEIQKRSLGRQGRYIPSYGINTYLNSNRTNQKFLGYHPQTPSWVKASQYSITNSRSYTFNASAASADGIMIGFSATSGTGVTTFTSANGSRYSRLCMTADVTITKYRYDEYESGTNILLRSYTFYNATVHNTYINVCYQ